MGPAGQWEEWSWVERLRALEQQGEPKFNQLKKIFEITGKPTEAQIDSITTMPATIYSLKGMKGDSLWKDGQEAKGWSSLVPKATPTANDLLVKLMQLDPRQRITAMQGLQHPYCKQLNKDFAESEYPALKPVAPGWVPSGPTQSTAIGCIRRSPTSRSATLTGSRSRSPCTTKRRSCACARAHPAVGVSLFSIPV